MCCAIFVHDWVVLKEGTSERSVKGVLSIRADMECRNNKVWLTYIKTIQSLMFSSLIYLNYTTYVIYSNKNRNR